MDILLASRETEGIDDMCVYWCWWKWKNGEEGTIFHLFIFLQFHLRIDNNNNFKNRGDGMSLLVVSSTNEPLRSSWG